MEKKHEVRKKCVNVKLNYKRHVHLHTNTRTLVHSFIVLRKCKDERVMDSYTHTHTHKLLLSLLLIITRDTYK